MTSTLVLACDSVEIADVARGLGADVLALPPVDQADATIEWPWADALDEWRTTASAGGSVPRVVVAPWTAPPREQHLVEIDLAGWCERAELAVARWIAALGVAKARCADGGAIVALVDRPAPLDCAGWAPETGVADAVEALTRSLARSEGPRGVRVNAVTTPARLTTGPVVSPNPPLGAFPGSVRLEAAGAVRLLLDPDALGLTGTVLNADAGRSWR